MLSTILALAAIAFSLTAAHPGEHHDNLELVRRMKHRSLDADGQLFSS